jgi:hypothetical protein
LVPGDRLIHANSRLWVISSLVSIAAAPAGFYLLSRAGMAPTVLALAGCYALSAVALFRLRRSADAVVPQIKPKLLDGVRISLGEPRLRLIMAIGAGSGVSGGAVYGMLVVFGTDALGLASSDARISWVIAGSGLGAFLGALLAPALSSFTLRPLSITLLLIDLLLMGSFALMPYWLPAALVVCAWNLVHTTLMVSTIATRQRITPMEYQGRVNGVGRIVAWGSVPVGTVACGLLAENVGIRTAILVCCIPVALSAAYCLQTRIGRGREARP